MAGKRGNGEGTIYQDPQGRWHGQLLLPNGKRKNVYGEKKREVQEKLAQLRREVDAGLHSTTEGEKTVRAYAQGWLDHNRHRLRGKTYRGYDSIMRTHLDEIGDIPLSELKPLHIQEHYTRKLQKFAPTTVHHIHAFIHVMLDSAVRLGIIPRNYSDYVDAPGLKPKEIKPLSEAEMRQVILAVQGDRLEALFVLALATDMREAEMLGLRWEDIDFERARVRIAMTLHLTSGVFTLEPPKSRSSMRTLPLPALALDALRSWRESQQSEEETVGDAWMDKWGLAFTTEVGLPIRYDWLIRHFRSLIIVKGVSGETRIHDLRHTFATLLLERGVPIKVVSELLGHSSIGITLAIYGHVTPRMKDTAMVQVAEMLRLPDIL